MSLRETLAPFNPSICVPGHKFSSNWFHVLICVHEQTPNIFLKARKRVHVWRLGVLAMEEHFSAHPRGNGLNPTNGRFLHFNCVLHTLTIITNYSMRFKHLKTLKKDLETKTNLVRFR